MDASKLLDKAFERLENMSSDEVKQMTSDRGIVIPEEPSLRELVKHFIFDLGGSFRETVNSRMNYVWRDPQMIGQRKSITVKNSKSCQKVALSF